MKTILLWQLKSIGKRGSVSGIILAGLCSGAWAARLPEEQNNIDIYQKCNAAVVNITAVSLRNEYIFEVVPQKGLGSGAIIRSDGFIVTNHHVVGNAVQVEVTLADKSQFPAQVVGSDADSDIAVIRIQPPAGKKLTAIEWGTPESIAVGQKTLAIGNPFGLSGSLSVGILSSMGRDIRATNDRLIRDILQTDTAINPGNSGGPLLDSGGKLIGINTQIISRSGGSEGVGFAIHVKTVKKITEQLIQFGRVLRPELGIDGVGLPGWVLNRLGVPTNHGVMVTRLARGAAASGLKPADQEVFYGFRPIPFGGDVIYQIDNTPVNTLRDLMDYIVDKKTGETVTLHYYRGVKTRTAQVTLAIPKNPDGQGI